MALPKLEGLIRIATATTLGTFTSGGPPDVIIIPVGDYYLTTAGNGSRSLLAEIKYQIETTHGSGTATVTVADDTDTSTGLVTIAFSSAYTFVWSSTYLRDLLGFTGTLTPSATSFTGTAQAQCLWLPNCGRSGVLGPEGSNGHVQTDHTCVIAPSGAHRTLAYTARYVDTMNFAMVQGRKAFIKHETTANESFERFHLDVIAYGHSIRYYADRSDDAGSVYPNRTWFTKGGDYSPTPVISQWVGANSLWSFNYDVGKDVT
jgi:hypothetical protein